MTGYATMTANQKPEHKSGQSLRFTCLYGVQVWHEEHFDIRDAIQREKSLKRWRPSGRSG